METTKSETLGQTPTNNRGVQDIHFVGAISELKAKQWYLRRGYQVFNPEIQQGNIDFIAYKNGEFTRVQVKTAGWNYSNKRPQLVSVLSTGKESLKHLKDSNAYDVLFAVYDNNCWIIPLDEIETTGVVLATTAKIKQKTRKDFTKYRDIL